MPTMYASQNTFVCATMEQGISLDLTNVQAPCQIAWNTGSTAEILSNVNPGEYSVIVRDSNGCVGFMEFTIDTLAPVTVSADIYSVQCFGENSGSIEIVANGGHGNYTYEWNNGATTDNVYNLVAGVYNLTVTDGKGCTAIETFQLNQPEKLIAIETHQNQTSNHAGSVNITVIGGTMPYTYVWNNGATTEDMTGVAGGFYEVTVTDQKGCLASAHAFIEDNTIQEVNGGIYTFSTVYAGNVVFPGSSKLDYASKTADVETDSVLSGEMSIYPNPARDYATLTWTVLDVENVQIFDLSGKLIQTFAVQAMENKMQLSDLGQGEYLVKLNSVGGGVVVERVRFL
jgi:hypothetical protein